MKDFLQTLLTAFKAEILTPDEKMRMRLNLQAFISEHPAVAPWRVRILDSIIAFIVDVHQLVNGHGFRRVQGAFFALVVAVFAGTGTSVAAQNALPGDALYNWKIHFNEPLNGVVALTTGSEVGWNAELANRRLVEIEDLAVAGKLNPVTDRIVRSQLDSVTQQFDQNIVALAKNKDGAIAVAAAQSDLEASLSAHSDVLTALGQNDPAAKEAIAPILSYVKNYASSAEHARVISEDVLAASGEDAVKVAVTQNSTDAKVRLAAVRVTIEKAQPTLTASSSAVAATVTSDTQDEIDTAVVHADAGEYGKALSTLQQALRTEKKTEITVDAAARLDNKVQLTVIDASSTSASNASSTVLK